MAPRDPLPAPAGLKFITPPEVAERGARHRAGRGHRARQSADRSRTASAPTSPRSSAWPRPCRPLLPQLSGQWNGFQNKNSVQVTGPGGQTATVSVSTSTTATVTGSLLLFDFGKNWAATDAAKANSEFARESVELQKDLIALAVKQSYYNLLLSSRLVVVNAQAARSGRPEPAQRQGLLRGGHAAAVRRDPGRGGRGQRPGQPHPRAERGEPARASRSTRGWASPSTPRPAWWTSWPTSRSRWTGTRSSPRPSAAAPSTARPSTRSTRRRPPRGRPSETSSPTSWPAAPTAARARSSPRSTATASS